MEAGGVQVGRDSERQLVSSVLRDAAAGRPSALLVAGEPGIGKTSLVADVTSGPAADGHLVLWGRCLRFGADSSPYLPFTQILTQWHRQAEPDERVRVLAGAEQLGTIAPLLGNPTRSVDSARILSLLATTLDRIAEATPLVLVIDDAQWADGSSLDLLAYLIAGFDASQQLALLMTYRDTELGEGHRLHGWLADMIRLPAVTRVRLERLGFADAEELVARLADRTDTGHLAAEVVDKARGNPYFIELLLRGASDGRARGQDGGLREALLSSWHRLGPNAREVLQLLALGGRPVPVSVLERLAAARGKSPDEVASGLTDGAAAGLAILNPDDEAWFHHPLIPEVVASTLSGSARQGIHREYVKVLEPAPDAVASRAAHLALHHHGAGDLDDAFSWSLRAADAAAAVRGYAEECDHLQRACRLWDEAGETTRNEVGHATDLWRRASDSALRAGEHLLAVRLREEAIAREDGDEDPMVAVRLRLPLPGWREFCGLDPDVSVEATRSIVRVAEARCPGTPEHVQALALLAHTEAWAEDEAAPSHAAAAVRMARRTGSPEALAWALAARSQAPPWERPLADATEALALAREVGDPQLLTWATTRTANRLGFLGRDREAAELLLATFRQVVEAGSANEAMFGGGPYGALILLDFGQWNEIREILRWLLSQRLVAAPAALTRGVAALLALRTGDVHAGRMHLARARELYPVPPRPGGLQVFIELEALWALAEPREALALADRLMPAMLDLDPSGVGELLVIAGRSAGDLAESPGGRADATALLDRVERQCGSEADDGPWFQPVGPEDLIHPARRSLYTADRARCHGAANTARLWQEAAEACSAAGLVWHEALASYRLARAQVAEGGPRREVASALRHAARIATDLGATPILRDAEELARQVHVPLADPVPPESAASTPDDPLATLTPREREVLSHLVAGRTYAEIAVALFISEKTVSVHVSNLLRKTGTRSRVEVADLVLRTSAS